MSALQGTYTKKDFVIYNKFDNQPVLATEIDGYAYHENNPDQLKK